MIEELGPRFARSNTLYLDLVDAVPAGQLGARLPGLPSNSIGEQLWCVVGARESYARAARAGEWQGFTCQLSSEEVLDPEAVTRALRATASELAALLDRGPPPAMQGYLLDLLEHETQHHGQLIRYLYALRIERPVSWKERYALE